jgi:osmotically-inducible protein OsmY
MKTDIELQRDVLDELTWDPSVNPAHVGISVRDGIVSLTGHVSSYAEKYAAERAAERVYGVRAAANELEVRLPGGSARTDEDIAAAAAKALEQNVAIPSDTVKAMVSSAWVTLNGEADWQYQREAAESAIRYLPGVLGVTNLVVLRPHATYSDIKTRIEDALRRTAELDAKRVEVEVADGHVTLTGNVRSLAERQQAERAAWAAPGVCDVEDRIAVEP